MSATLLRNCLLFDPRSGTLTSGSSVLVTDDKITEVSDQAIAPQGAKVFDLGGSCPGGFSGCTYMDMSELEVYGS